MEHTVKRLRSKVYTEEERIQRRKEALQRAMTKYCEKQKVSDDYKTITRERSKRYYETHREKVCERVRNLQILNKTTNIMNSAIPLEILLPNLRR